MSDNSDENKEIFSINSRKITDYFNNIVLPALEKQRKQIIKVVREVIGPAALKSIKDEKKLQQIFGKMYIYLPKSVMFFVDQEDFVKWCQKNRSLIDNMLEKYLEAEGGEQQK
jgi:hypothetical protein